MENLNWHDQDGNSNWDETIGPWPTSPETQILVERSFGPAYLEQTLAALDSAGLDIKAWLADQGITECTTQNVLCQAVIRVVRQLATGDSQEDPDIDSLTADMLRAAVRTVTEDWDLSLHLGNSDLEDNDPEDTFCKLWTILTGKLRPGSNP